MTPEERMELDKKFDKYFRDTFIIERGDLYDKYSDRKIDVSYDFDKEKYATPESVFATIKEAFENGHGEEMELFLRKLDLLAKDKVDATNTLNNKALFGDEISADEAYKQGGTSTKEMVVINGEYALGHNTSEVDGLRGDPLSELINNKDDVSKIDFKNITELINTMDSSELYAIMNSNSSQFQGIRTERAHSYLNIKESLDQSAKRKEQLEILMLQRYLDKRGNIAFNQNFIDEMVSDMIRYGARKTIGAYLMPLTVFPKAITFGPGSIYDTFNQMRKSRKIEKIKKIVEGEEEYKFEYKTFERMLQREYYHTELDDVKEMDKSRKHIKAMNVEDLIEMVDFNSQDYLKEYKEIMPFLKKHRLRKKTMPEMRAFYHNIDRVFSDIETRSGRQLSDITKRMIRNDLVLNTFVEKDLIYADYAVIDDKESNWFGLKVPIKDGRPDYELLEKSLVLVGTKNLREIQIEIDKAFGKRNKYLNQIAYVAPDEFGGIDLGSDLEENKENIRMFFDHVLPFIDSEEIEEVVDEVLGKEGEDVFSRQPLTVKVFDQTFVCKSKLDARILSVINEKYSETTLPSLLRDLLENYVYKTDGIKSTNNYVFEDLYENITTNDNFKLSKKDLEVLEDKKNEIERSLRNHETIDSIMDKHLFSLKDYKKFEYILRVFQKNMEINDTNEFYGENPNINRDANTKHERYYETGSDPRAEVFTQNEPDFADDWEPSEEDFRAYQESQKAMEIANQIMSEVEIGAVLSTQPAEAQKKVIELADGLKNNDEFLEREKAENEVKMEQNFRAVITGKPKLNIVNKTNENSEILANNTFNKEDQKARRNIEEVNAKKMMKKEFQEFKEQIRKSTLLDQETKALITENDDFSYKIEKLSSQKYEMKIFGKDKENSITVLNLTVNPDYQNSDAARMKSVLEDMGKHSVKEKAEIIVKAIESVDGEKIKEILKKENLERKKQLIPEFEKGETRGRLSNDSKQIFRLAREDYSTKKYTQGKADEINKVSKEMLELLKKGKIEKNDNFSENIAEKFNNGTLTLLELSEEVSKKMGYKKNPMENLFTKENKNANQAIDNIGYKLKSEINKKAELDKTVPEKEKENPKNIVDTKPDGTVKDAKTDLERFEKHAEKVKEEKIFESKKIEQHNGKIEELKKETEEVKKEVEAAVEESVQEHAQDEKALTETVKKELDEATREREEDLKSINAKDIAEKKLMIEDDERIEEIKEETEHMEKVKEINVIENEDKEEKEKEIKEEKEQLSKEENDESKNKKRGGFTR